MARIGRKGQVVIPKAIRDRLGLRPGEEVVFIPEPAGVRIEPAPDIGELAGVLAGFDLVTELEGEHRRELGEEAKSQAPA